MTGEILDGTVVRPLRSVNPDQQEYSGLIRVGGLVTANGEEVVLNGSTDPIQEFEFGIMGLTNKRELLQVGDPVQLQVCLL